MALFVHAATEEAPPSNEVLPRAASGWKLELIAKAPALKHPSVVCSAPDGRMFVAEDPMDISTDRADVTEGRILCIQTNGTLSVFAEKLHAVFGMKYLEGKLYVLHNPKFSVFRDVENVGKDRVDLIESTNPEPWAKEWNDHIPANFVLGMDGYFYVAVGDKGVYGAVGKDGKRVDLYGGGILRLRTDGTELEVYATGLRNILDVGMTDEDELFTYDNTDEKHWMSRLTHVVDSGYYGYPFDFHPRKPYILWSIADYGPGAATGVFVDTEGRLPGRFAGSLFLSDFGKRQVTSVPVARQDSTFQAGDPTELFIDPPGDFRPVGISLSADGSAIYICDWQHRDNKDKVAVGRLWRLTHTNPNASEPRPSWYVAAASGRNEEFSTGDLLAALDHPARSVRLTAQRRLTDKGTSAMSDLIETFQNPRFSPRVRWHALWALDGIDRGEAARSAIVSSIYSLEVSLRRQCLRQLGTRRVISAVPEILGRLEDDEPSVRFQAAVALGRIADASALVPLQQLLINTNSDETVRFAAFTAMRKIAHANPTVWNRVVSFLSSPQLLVRDRVSLVLRDNYELPLVEALVGLASNAVEPVLTRLQAIQLLSDLYRRTPAWKGEWWAYHPADTPPPEKTEAWEGTPRIAAFLIDRVKETSAPIRRASLAAIGRNQVREAAFTIRALFDRESDPDLRQLMMDTFGKLKDRDAVPFVLAALQAKEAPVALRQSALIASAQIGTPTNATTEILSSAVAVFLDQSAPSTDLATRALDTLGQLQEPSVLPVVYRRLKDLNPEIVVAALKTLDRLGGSTAEVLPLLKDGRAPVRASAIRFLGQQKAKETIPQILTLASDESVRDEVLKALAQMPDARATDLFVQNVNHRNFALRETVTRALRSIRDQALAGIEANSSHYSDETLTALRQVYDDHPAAKKGPLFAVKVSTKSAEEYQRYALDHAGNALEGQRLFLAPDGLGCVKCHRVRDFGGDVGPDLTQIGSQFDRAALIESVLWPSRVVREGYQQVVLELSDGETLSGLIKGETQDTLTLRDAEGRNQTVKRSEIASRRPSALSLMPEGLQASLSLSEFSDLIAYLAQLKASTRTAFAPPPTSFQSLFNGTNLAGWKTEPGKESHWTAAQGILEHDGLGEDLWTETSYGDFRLQFEWRWVEVPKVVSFSLIDTNGNTLLDAAGKPVVKPFLSAGDSGIYLRGSKRAEANLFSHPLGSGDISPVRSDPNVSPEQRRAFTSQKQADRPLGEWNTMSILVRADRITVTVNGENVVVQAKMPDLPERGPIGLQRSRNRLQFRNLFIRPMEDFR